MRKWKDVATALKVIPSGQKLYKGPVKLHIRAFFNRPTKHLKRHGKGLRTTAPKYHHQKPDADNIAKFVGDCLNGLAFYDDAQVHHLTVQKLWVSDRKGERAEVELWYE